MFGRNRYRLEVLLAALIVCVGMARGADFLRENDVVAFVGGADAAGFQETGHLEAFITKSFPSLHLRFRNFAREGDTVFAQPRDFAFPTLAQQLDAAHATVVIAQFGRIEALENRSGAAAFAEAYERLLGSLSREGRRFLLITPAPFERSSNLLPDLTSKNFVLAEYVESIRVLAAKHRWKLVDAYSELSGRTGLTADGLQLTPRGQALFAAACARQLNLGAADGPGQADDRGTWPQPDWEKLRQTILEKNRLWFYYSRPQNWAFLGGDRTNQPSSRDHRDPSIRWFPKEIEEFVPLIRSKEEEINGLAQGMTRGKPEVTPSGTKSEETKK